MDRTTWGLMSRAASSIIQLHMHGVPAPTAFQGTTQCGGVNRLPFQGQNWTLRGAFCVGCDENISESLLAGSDKQFRVSTALPRVQTWVPVQEEGQLL